MSELDKMCQWQDWSFASAAWPRWRATAFHSSKYSADSDTKDLPLGLGS